VEDSIDRMPMHPDQTSAVAALDSLKASLHVADGWRETYTDKKAYTYYQKATKSQSRIDRIYATEQIIQSAREWKIESVPDILTDHALISVLATTADAPKMGRDKWSIPKWVLKHKDLVSFVNDTGKEILASTIIPDGQRTDLHNTQVKYAKWKKNLLSEAKRIERKTVPREIREIRELEDLLDKTINNIELEEEERKTQASEIVDKIVAKKAKRHT
ncbi:hypothetical protein DL96DRAFT_1465192, partial [Flagelloscypha sp. PMI_526]